MSGKIQKNDNENENASNNQNKLDANKKPSFKELKNTNKFIQLGVATPSSAGAKPPIENKQKHLRPIITKQGQQAKHTTAQSNWSYKSPQSDWSYKSPQTHREEERQENLRLNSPKPLDKGKKPDPNKYWNFNDFKKIYAQKVDESELTKEEKVFFKDYAQKAQHYLDKPNTTWAGTTPLTGEMFANAAKRMYLLYDKDMSKVVPLEFALTQAQFESHFGTNKNGRESLPRNPYSIGEYNNSTADFVKEIKDAPMGVATYYHLMAEDYLSKKNPEQLLQDFTNERGSRYQVNDNGVVDHAYEKKISKQMLYIQNIFKKLPGGYKPAVKIPTSFGTVTTTTTQKRPTKLTKTPLPKAKSGFSVGLPSGQYSPQLINYPQDVRKIQQRLLEVGLLSEVDFNNEYPKEAKKPITKPDYSNINQLKSKGLAEAQNPQNSLLGQMKQEAEAKKQAEVNQKRDYLLTWLKGLSEQETKAIAENPLLNTIMGQFALENGVFGVTSKKDIIAELNKLRGQQIEPIENKGIESPTMPPAPDLPYVHYMSDFEQTAMELYGKVPEGNCLSISSIPKTIAAIEIFQREVVQGTVDSRIDPNGTTLSQLMAASKESVAEARKAYVEKQKEDINDDVNLEELLAELGADFKDWVLNLLNNAVDKFVIVRILKSYLGVKSSGNKNIKKESSNPLEVKKVVKTLSGVLDSKKSSYNDKDGKGKARKIIETVRAQLDGYPAKVKAFKKQSGVSQNEKLRILGRLAAETARLELLMGFIFYRGSGQKQNWEVGNNGDKEFLGYYYDKYNLKFGTEWCAIFVTSILNEVAGYAPVDKKGKRGKNAGYGWISFNTTSLHDSVKHTSSIGIDTHHDKKITKGSLDKLRVKVAKAAKQEDKYNLVKDFFKGEFMPQAGDLLAVGPKKADGKTLAPLNSKYHKQGFNHSTMIEKLVFDDKNKRVYLYTVEGNYGNRGGGRKIDLTRVKPGSYTDLSYVTQISRVGLTNYGISKSIDDGRKDSNLKADASSSWDEGTLLEPLIKMNGLLKKYAEDNKYIKKKNDDAPIAELMQLSLNYGDGM